MTDSDKPTHNSLAAALAAFQHEVPTIGKTSEAKAGSFSYKYADLAETLTRVQPLLTKHGLVFQSFPTVVDGHSALRYTLTHAPTGDAQSDVMLLVLPKPDPQGLGSGITYCRRYSLTAVLNLVTDDDDGQAATQSARNATAQRSADQHVAVAKKELGAVETATAKDVQEIKAAAHGLTRAKVNLALNSVGAGGIAALEDVPKAKVAELVKALSGAPR